MIKASGPVRRGWSRGSHGVTSHLLFAKCVCTPIKSPPGEHPTQDNGTTPISPPCSCWQRPSPPTKSAIDNYPNALSPYLVYSYRLRCFSYWGASHGAQERAREAAVGLRIANPSKRRRDSRREALPPSTPGATPVHSAR